MPVSLFEEGKPAARRGRKARGLARCAETARLHPQRSRTLPSYKDGSPVSRTTLALRPRIRAALAAVLALVAAGAGSALPAAAATHTAGTGRVAEIAVGHPTRSVEVIVRLAAGRTEAQGRAAVRLHHGRVTGDLHIFNGLVAQLRARDAVRLQRDPAVAAVSLNATVRQSINTKELRTAYPYAADAPPAWNNSSGGGSATGLGVGVAVIDTGIAGALPDFRASYSDPSSRVIGSAVVNPLATTAADAYGHGTHVAGIIAGNGNARPYGDPLRGQYVGIAPQANLVSVKVADDTGGATVLDVIYGLQFVVDHKADYNIRVANLSLESTDVQSAATDPLDAAAEAAWFAGITVVAAAGNHGTDSDAVSHAPGNDPYVITVGGLDDMGTRTRDDDAVASWSSRGATQDGYPKPDIYAPGAHIVSNLAPGSAFASLCPDCVVSGEYIRAGGTSMSAPVVSGVAALVVQRNPNLTPDQVKRLIVRTAHALPGNVPEADADVAVRDAANSNLTSANQGLTPSTLIDPATGGIDYTKSSWSRSSWGGAPSALTADWARSSWSCECSMTATGEIDPTRSSWSRSSWSTSWTK
jgi:serine protease AprX